MSNIENIKNNVNIIAGIIFLTVLYFADSGSVLLNTTLWLYFMVFIWVNSSWLIKLFKVSIKAVYYILIAVTLIYFAFVTMPAFMAAMTITNWLLVIIALILFVALFGRE